MGDVGVSVGAVDGPGFTSSVSTFFIPSDFNVMVRSNHCFFVFEYTVTGIA